MENSTFYYRGIKIEIDVDDMYPYHIPALALINVDSDITETTCRFRTLPAAKAAITRHLLAAYRETLYTAAMRLRIIADNAHRMKEGDMNYLREFALNAAESIEEALTNLLTLTPKTK